MGSIIFQQYNIADSQFRQVHCRKLALVGTRSP